MKLRVIDALQRPDVLDGSKWFALPVPVLGTDRTTTDHDLPTMTVGIDPARRKAYYCDRLSAQGSRDGRHFGDEAAFTLDRLLDECRLVDAKKGPDA